MTLHKRLERLEAQRGPATEAVTVIYFCDPKTSEPNAAIILGQGTVARREGETAQGFYQRIAPPGQDAPCLPHNGHDALADPNAPTWARPEIILRALKQKHDAPTE